LGEHHPCFLEIVDHRDGGFWRHGPRPPGGTCRVKVDPAPSLLSTVMRPASILASRRQIERPSPAPPYWRVTESSACRKSSKIFCWSFSAIPIPLSFTASEISSRVAS